MTKGLIETGWPGFDRPPFKDGMLRVIVGGYCLLAAVPFIYAAVHTRFYRSYLEPSTAILYGSFLVALVRRQYWAWFMLVVFNAFTLISRFWEGGRLAFLVINAIGFVLLLSPPMRYYVRAPADGS